MPLQRIKMIVSTLWLLTVVVGALVFDLSWAGGVVLAALAALPPLALLLLWNDPAPTMSESINNARR